MIETKVAAGSFTGILTGLISWALVAYIPAFRSGLPPAVAALIPVAVAWLAHSVAGYMAPHTPHPVPQNQIQAGKDYIQRAYGSGSVTVTPPPADRPVGGFAPTSGPAEPPQPPPGSAGASA